MKCIYCGNTEDLSESDIIPDALTNARIINKNVCRVAHNNRFSDLFESKVISALSFITNELDIKSSKGKKYASYEATIKIDGTEYETSLQNDKSIFDGRVLKSKDKKHIISSMETITKIAKDENLVQQIDVNQIEFEKSVRINTEIFFDESMFRMVSKIAYEWYCAKNKISGKHSEFDNIISYIINGEGECPVSIIQEKELYKYLSMQVSLGSHTLFAFETLENEIAVVVSLFGIIMYQVSIAKNKPEICNNNFIFVELRTDSTRKEIIHESIHNAEEYFKSCLEPTNFNSVPLINGMTIMVPKNFFDTSDVLLYPFVFNSVRKITKQLLEYKEVASNIIPLFITPNEIPSKYAEIMNQNGIQIWDKTFIGNEFYVQIQKTEPASFRLFFDLPYETTGESDKYRKLIKELNECSPGWANWVEYQNLIGRILEALFCPPLNSPISQSNDKSKKNRRDFILPNYSKTNDTWKFLRDRYYADFIVVDAKNSKKNISKEDVLQIANYLKKDGTGLFGIIIARKGTNSASENALRDMWIHQQKMIVVLNDVDMEQMLLDKKAGDEDPARLILQKIEDFRLLI